MTKPARKQQGSTLVEVLVAVSVFLIVMGSLVAGYLSARRIVAKQKENVYFEAICSDIAEYGKIYGSEWNEKYFASVTTHKFGSDGNEITDESATVSYYGIYFAAKFNTVTTKDDAKYLLFYSYNSSGQLVVNVKNIISDYTIVENLTYEKFTEETTGGNP